MSDGLKATAYVSTSLITSGSDVDNLVTHARLRNLRQEVTGVLLFSGNYFAQWLEGAPSDVDQIIGEIRSDVRHKEVFVFFDRRVTARRFQGWSLAYQGTATFVDNKLMLLATTDVTSSEFQDRSSSVLELFTEFALPVRRDV